MTKKQRIKVYEKYNGHCAYCGRAIQYKDMQVDHIKPLKSWNGAAGTDDVDNLNPSCRRCNHYKRAHSLETFREMLKTLHERTQKIYINKVAEDYGVIKVEPWDGVFYFEKARGWNEQNETNYIQRTDGGCNTGGTENADEKGYKGQGHHELV